MEYGTINILTARTLGLLAGLGVAAGTALAQDYGFDWVTIGDPGNRDTLPDEVPRQPYLEIGWVDYEFRTTRQPLSTVQYLEFVQAYAPHWDGAPNDIALTGYWIGAFRDGQGNWQYEAIPGMENYAASLSWEMAARFANWLHNGKADEKAAFENGAYDTSTFYYEDGWQHQATHNPDARFWIPTFDEFTKAAYWDPDKNNGEGGYWRNPDSGDEQLFAALPENGGETIGDALAGPDYFLGEWDLGQYPLVQSPWGLADVSGTLPSWTEGISNPNLRTRYQGGSAAHDIFYDLNDRIDEWWSNSPQSLIGSFRIVAVVPSPSTIPIVCTVLIFITSRRRGSSRQGI